MRWRRFPLVAVGSLIAVGLAAGWSLAQETAEPTTLEACSDQWYGGCPDACTRAFTEMQRSGNLNQASLEDWAATCVKDEEQQEREQDQAESDSATDSQQSRQAGGEERAQADSAQRQEQEETGQRAGESEQQQQAENTASGSERSASQGQRDEQTPQAQQEQQAQQGQQEQQERRAPQTQQERQAERQDGEQGASSSQGGAQRQNGQQESQEERRETASNPPIGESPTATPGAEGEEQTGPQTPVPRGAGSTGRSDPALERERTLRGLGERYGGPAEVSEQTCRAANAPLCTGFCRAGICAPDGDGGGCVCRPAQTPTNADTRRRALCATAGPSRLRVSVCQAPDEAATASCAAVGSETSRACETLWTARYDSVEGLEGGRGDLDLLLTPVPLWDWARDGEAIDAVSVPLGDSAKSADPLSVWESAQASLPTSDIRVFAGSRSGQAVKLLRRRADGTVEAQETPLRRGELALDCADDAAEVCAEDRLTRLRLTLLAQAPESRILASQTRDSAAWYGECAAARLNGQAQVLCYQVRTADGEQARAWRPLRLDWLGEGASARYAEALLETGDTPESTDSAALERRFFEQAAATDGDAPPLLLAAARESDRAAYAEGDLPAAIPDTGSPLAGLLVYQGERLRRLDAAGAPAELAPRNRSLFAEALETLDETGDPALARLAGAAILDEEMIALSWGEGVGACLRRSRPEVEIACFHERRKETPALWRPLHWPSGPAQPRIDRPALLETVDQAVRDETAVLDPMLERVLETAVTPRGRHLRLFDLYEDRPGAGSGLALAFRRANLQERPLFADCGEDALFFSQHRREAVEARLTIGAENARDCAAAFPETYARHRGEIQARLGERLPGADLTLRMRDERALLSGRSPAGIELLEVWSAAPEAERRFPTVTASCLMHRAEQAAGLAPDNGAPARQALERALLVADWRALGWRANPLGLVLRAESCEEDA